MPNSRVLHKKIQPNLDTRQLKLAEFARICQVNHKGLAEFGKQVIQFASEKLKGRKLNCIRLVNSKFDKTLYRTKMLVQNPRSWLLNIQLVTDPDFYRNFFYFFLISYLIFFLCSCWNSFVQIRFQ